MISNPTFASRFLFYPMLVVVLILHFSLFGDGTHNPVGIRGLNELYLAACIGCVALVLMASTEDTPREFRLVMYYALYSCVVFVGMPAVFSHLMYGQPLVYGVIEERRVLFALGFVPLLLLGRRVTAWQFERAFLSVALLGALLSWGFKFGLVPDLRDEVASWDRPDRSSIGVFLMCFSFFYCIALWHRGTSLIDGSKRARWLYLVFAAFLLLTLIFATQTRQLIVLCLCFALFYLRAKAVIWAFCIAGLLAPLYLFPGIFPYLGIDVSFYAQMFEQGVEDGVRPHTIATIFNHLDQVNWLPSGSLSLMWENGFERFFGEHFFLADVGIFGLLFRFGFLSFVVIPVSLYLYQRIAKNIYGDLSFGYAVILAFIVIWPLMGLFAYVHSVIAMLFVVHSLSAQHRRCQEQVHEYRAYPQLQGSF